MRKALHVRKLCAKLHGGRVVHSRNQKSIMAVAPIGKNDFETSDKKTQLKNI